jgi:hypothetical protein
MDQMRTVAELYKMTTGAGILLVLLWQLALRFAGFVLL